MSSLSQAPVSSLHSGSILDDALNEYRKNTGKDLLSHPLAIELQRCDTVDSILAVLQRQANTFEQQYRDSNRGLMKWIRSSVVILYSISAILGDGVGLMFPPAKPIFTGIGIILAAAIDVSASHDVLLDLFRRVGDFFERFEVYTRSFLNTKVAEALVNVVVKILNILSIATKEIEKSRTRRFFNKLGGKRDIEDALGELENLIQGEHYMVAAQVLQDVSTLKHDMEAVGAAVRQITNKGGKEERQKIQKETREWFSPQDPSINHNIAWKVYHAGSATWVFGHSVFTDWMSAGSLLWVHGKPGSGKSILCSAIIQHIMALCEAGQASIAYFYFDFRDKEKQNVRNLVTSLLFQLSAFSDPCCDIIRRVYSAHGNGTRQPTNDVLTNCLKEMLTAVAEHPIYIIMDALDECPDHSGWPTAREEVLVILKDLVGMHLPNLRVCVTSRPEVDIKSVLNQLTIHSISLHNESEQQKGIADYVKTIVNSDGKMRQWPDEDKELVVKVLSERADGMFRWVVCQLETLRRSAQRNVRGILEKLPKTLDETYERVLKDINEDNREHARRLLHCLAVANRPLRVEELAEILTFDFDNVQGGIPKFHADWRWKDQEEAVLSTCSSLIAVVDDRRSRVVQFSHFSVKEFLMSDRLASSTELVSRYHILPGPAHTILAQACLGFLLHLDDHIDKESDKGSPLARYAAKHWVAHAQFEGVASSVKGGMQSLFDPDKRHLVAWLGIYNIDTQSSGVSLSDIPNPLYYSALCGFHDLVQHLVTKYPQLVNAIGGEFGSPLLAALYGQHIRVAEFLLRNGGKIDVRGTNEQTPLHMAITKFWEEDTADAVQFLLKHKADVNSRRGDLCTPLHLAASYEDLEVAQMLLEHGADIDSRNDEGKTSLHLLLEGDAQDIDSRVARLLLQRGANANAQDKDHTTPLLLATQRGLYEIARILLGHGAEPNMKNNDGKTLLHLLLEDGCYFKDHIHIISPARLLLERGANANAQDKDHTTPLLLAMERESYEIARILLEHRAEPNVKNNDCKTPLHLLLEGDWDPFFEDDILGLVRLLLERGANVNAQDKDHTTPLLLAIERESYEIARILLDHGARPNVKDNDCKTPLHLLLEGESDFLIEDYIFGLVRLLLERGANVNAKDKDHITPLLLAMERKSYEIARVLLRYGAEPNVKNEDGKTPLHLLLERRFYDSDDVNDVLVVERLLLECGADVNARDEANITPLHLASNHRRLEIAQIILDCDGAEKDRRRQLHMTLEERGAGMNAQNEDHTTHLHSACFFGKLEMVRELLDHGARANTENIRGETPLHLVSRGQYDTQESGVGIVQLLLGRSANVNAQDKGYATPLHLATYYGRPEIARVLLYHGARANTKNELGQTPLHLVLEGNRSGRDDVGIVYSLLEHGADANAQDWNNETPLHLASKHGKLAIGRVLLIHGAHANAENSRGQTPLHSLSLWPWRNGDGFLFAGILVDGGADVNARDKDQETPLHMAYRKNRPDIARSLLMRGADNDAKNNKGETPFQLAPRLTATE